MTIRFAEDYTETMVFRRDEMEKATDEVMADNGIPRRGSDDVLVIWNQKISGR